MTAPPTITPNETTTHKTTVNTGDNSFGAVTVFALLMVVSLMGAYAYKKKLYKNEE